MASQSTLSVCCPVPTAIDSVVTTLNPCPDDIGQIQKLIFWRRGNSIDTVANAILTATWDALLIAADDTRAIFSPFVANVESPFSEPREFGGGNETRWGSSIRKGAQSTTFKASMYQEDQDVITSLKQLACEAMDVLFVNEANQLIYHEGPGGAVVQGFQIAENSFNVSDKGIGGQDDADVNIITFNLKPNWS